MTNEEENQMGSKMKERLHTGEIYYPNDDDTQKPLLQWRSHGNILYSNWLNYYVYQETPYEFINMDEIIRK